MALPDLFSNLGKGIRRVGRKSSTATPTFNPNAQDGKIAEPAGREHLNDLLTERQTQNSRDLLRNLFKYDTDFSAAVGGYLTLADTQLTVLAHDYEGEIDGDATREAQRILTALTQTTDYSSGFVFKPGLRALCGEIRSMVLLRGATGAELVFSKQMVPDRIQQVDMATVEWTEKEAGVYKPRQKAPGGGDPISLDIPNFFVAYHRRLPVSIYPESDFVSAINTIAARQQVINDLYRIMRLTGFPRITIQLVEEVMRKNAPSSVQNDPELLKKWMVDRRNEISQSFANLRADQPFTYYDSAEVSILNKDKPGASLDITSVIETLNAQNQAGLKTMGTIIGRGSAGVNTASVEARIAAMNADQLNVPVAEILSKVLTFALNIYGIQGIVTVKFAPAELRPHLELEPQRVVKATRLRTDLSLGLISDEEYHLEMYGRLPPPGAPKLSGTGFDTPKANVNTDDISPNSDPLGRSVASEDSAAARSN